MNIEKFKKNLIKINKFNELTNSELDSLSRIEHDLLMEYIRKLYKAVIEDGEKTVINKDEEKKISELPGKEKIQVKPDFSRNNIVEEMTKPTEQAIVADKEIIRETVKYEEKADSKEIKTEKNVENTKQQALGEDIENVKPNISEEFKTIFNEKTTNELSEKLSMLPVDDLKKAFGLNEKIFTINELFGGNAVAFEEAIKELNTIGSFVKAKDYIMSNLVVRFDWDNENKFKKAEQFVRSVRRRYQN
ncbi:MAG: hypothetical protein ACM3PT_09860 [Deltaproteobacteria bacterium]